MATVLFAHQLGQGFGHLMRMRPMAAGLVARGHRVYVVFRDLAAAGPVYGDVGVRFLQAPAKFHGRRSLAGGIGFANLMGAGGFGADPELFALASAWRNLYRLARPDLIVFDHSPIALLAARGLPARRALIGTGFCCPPPTSPLPAIRPPADESDAARQAVRAMAAAEEGILRRVNRILAAWGTPPLNRLGQLYGDVDECFLTTFPELDHFGAHDGARYWGPANGSGGAAPDWAGAPRQDYFRGVVANLVPFETPTQNSSAGPKRLKTSASRSPLESPARWPVQPFFEPRTSEASVVRADLVSGWRTRWRSAGGSWRRPPCRRKVAAGLPRENERGVGRAIVELSCRAE